MEAQRPSPRDTATAMRLRVLRHALASYLSGATLQVAVARRRLKAGEAEAVKEKDRDERVDGPISRAEAELAHASVLIDSLAAIAEGLTEPAASVSLLACVKRATARIGREAVPVRVKVEEKGDGPSLVASSGRLEDAVLELTRLAADGKAETAVWCVEKDGATLTYSGALPVPRPDRLFELVEVPRAEALFIAAWAVEASGGRLDVLSDGGTVTVHLRFEAAA
jgi:hypothetical protein